MTSFDPESVLVITGELDFFFSVLFLGSGLTFSGSGSTRPRDDLILVISHNFESFSDEVFARLCTYLSRIQDHRSPSLEHWL